MSEKKKQNAKIYNSFQIFFSISFIILFVLFRDTNISYFIVTEGARHNFVTIYFIKFIDLLAKIFGLSKYFIPIIFIVNSILYFFGIKKYNIFYPLLILCFVSSILSFDIVTMNSGILGIVLSGLFKKITKYSLLLNLLVLLIFVSIFAIHEIGKRNKKIRKRINERFDFNIFDLPIFLIDKFQRFYYKIIVWIRKKRDLNDDIVSSLEEKFVFASNNSSSNANIENNNVPDEYINKNVAHQENKSQIYSPYIHREVKSRNLEKKKNEEQQNGYKKLFANESNQKLYEKIYEKKCVSFDNSIIKKNFNGKLVQNDQNKATNDNINHQDISNDNEVGEVNNITDYHDREELLAGIKANCAKIQSGDSKISYSNRDHIDRIMITNVQCNSESQNLSFYVANETFVKPSVEIHNLRQNVENHNLTQNVKNEDLNSINNQKSSNTDIEIDLKFQNKVDDTNYDIKQNDEKNDITDHQISEEIKCVQHDDNVLKSKSEEFIENENGESILVNRNSHDFESHAFNHQNSLNNSNILKERDDDVLQGNKSLFDENKKINVEVVDNKDTINTISFSSNDSIGNHKILEKDGNQKVKEVIAEIKKIDYSKFRLPDINFLSHSFGKKIVVNNHQAQVTGDKLVKVLKDFSVFGKIISYHIGPVITLYEFEPLPGTKSSRVIGLADDIARSLSAVSARISVISGKNALGIELPNEQREIVLLKDILDSDEYKTQNYQLPVALGKNISGEPIVVDLAKMPHLLVAGTTGSGKSVAVNVMIVSILYSMKPDECKFIMIDPKMLELSVYNGIPHLLTPVVTDPKKAVVALKWVVKEMEERYRMMSYLGVRNIKGYNEKIDEAIEEDIELKKEINIGLNKETGEIIMETIMIEKKKYPYIVVIVDEMADLMLVAGKEIEFYIQRLAQMARAAGIHIVMATQRPSVDVITGVIKANLPTRISFAVTSKIDSRTILGEQGAEQLLGMGDMLYMAAGNKIVRIHGPFVSDNEVEKIVNFLKSFGPPDYLDAITNQINSAQGSDDSGGDLDDDSLNENDEDYQRAVDLVMKEKRVSISYIQRFLRIGYNKSASFVERMEREGIVSAPNNQGKRELIE